MPHHVFDTLPLDSWKKWSTEFSLTLKTLRFQLFSYEIVN